MVYGEEFPWCACIHILIMSDVNGNRQYYSFKQTLYALCTEGSILVSNIFMNDFSKVHQNEFMMLAVIPV